MITSPGHQVKPRSRPCSMVERANGGGKTCGRVPELLQQFFGLKSRGECRRGGRLELSSTPEVSGTPLSSLCLCTARPPVLRPRVP